VSGSETLLFPEESVTVTVKLPVGVEDGLLGPALEPPPPQLAQKNTNTIREVVRKLAKAGPG
jgi:hypothetical protein